MKYLDDTARSNLEALCWARAETSRRDVALIMLALYTGARASELLTLTWRDVDLDTGLISIKTLKGGKNRDVPISRKLLAILMPLRDGTSDRLFDICEQRLRQIWYQWRPVKMPFHALRHTFGMRVYAKSRDLVFTQRAMGHRSLSSTSVYLQKQYSLAETRKLMGVK